MIKKRILYGTKLVKKAGKQLKASSDLFLLVEDDFRA